ncbi:hypothetical protein KY348_05810 [Candidatus Woesearchaeota archaeon]|nr:hypothetical protein [Candidatus Woesearchaeota archaeon]
MAKGFVGKKVNIFLLLMLILILLGFGGVSVYYQYTFKDINQKFNDISTGLGVCEQNLSQTSSALATAMKNLNSTETDIRKYDALYEQKAEELDKKKDELGDTQAELTRVTLQKEVYKKQIDQAYVQIIGFNKTINSLKKQIDDLEEDIDDLNIKVSCLKNTDDSEESGCL